MRMFFWTEIIIIKIIKAKLEIGIINHADGGNVNYRESDQKLIIRGLRGGELRVEGEES